jgi:hypothetical protein
MKNKKRVGKVSNGFAISSIILLIIAFGLLWIFTKKNNNLYITTLFAGILIIIDIITICLNKKYNETLNESNPLISLRMNKSFNHALFYWGIGIPLLIDALSNGLIDNWVRGLISSMLIILGIYQ